MKINQHPVRSLVGAAVIAIMSSQTVHAGGFSLYTESSAAAIGNYAAGVAAEAADASTAWYNPAGLVLLKKQEVVVSGVGVFPSTELTGTTTFFAPPLPPYVQTFSDLQGGESGFVPAIHFAQPLGNNAAFGLSVVSPFGLSTQYGENSPVRYAATLTDLRTIDVSPDIAGKITDDLSFGAGLDVQFAQVKFNGMLGLPNFASINPFVTPTTFDSTSVNKGSSLGFGIHAGLLGVYNDNHTRVGLNYQSKVSHTFRGTSTLSGRLADPLLTDPGAEFRSEVLMSNSIDLPDVLTLSGYQDVNDRLALLGSVVFTGWSSFNSIQLDNVAAFSITHTPNQVYVDATTPENYRDAWRCALGANYRVTDQFMMRVGGGYDQTPTVDSARDIRLPDANRWALSVGAHYQPGPRLGLDVGYTYLFSAGNPVINDTIPFSETSGYNVNAVGDVHAQLVGAQVTWAMDAVQVQATK